jgi:hypothetical protein
MSEPATARDVAALIQEGNVALIAGDAFSARQRFRQAIDADPDSAEAWVGMAAAVRPYREKREHLRRALELQPGHPGASAALTEVEARIAAGDLLAAASPREASAARNQDAQAAAALAPVAIAPAAPAPATLYCYIHPSRETGLRCTSCDRPICSDCVRPAPVGQLCPECAKARRPTNYKVSWVTLIIAGAISLIYAVVATYLGLQVLRVAGFFAFIVTFLLGPLAGNVLTRILDRVTGNKRGRVLQVTVSVCYAFGALPWLAALLFAGGGLGIVLLGLFTVLAITATIAALR